MTTKLKGMVITIFLVLLFSSPLLAQTVIPPVPTGYVIAPGYLLLAEKDIEEVVNAEVAAGIEEAVKEAVAIVVKEKDKEIVDLNLTISLDKDIIATRDASIAQLKRDKFNNIILWGGGGLLVGTGIGIVISFLAQMGK